MLDFPMTGHTRVVLTPMVIICDHHRQADHYKNAVKEGGGGGLLIIRTDFKDKPGRDDGYSSLATSSLLSVGLTFAIFPSEF